MTLDHAYLLAWAKAFVATQLIEVPIYLRFCVPRRPWVALGASTLTHPLLWALLWPSWFLVRASVLARAPWLGDRQTEIVAVTAVGEGLVWLTEGLWFRLWGGHQPWRWSLVANATSAGVGVLLYVFFRWP